MRGSQINFWQNCGLVCQALIWKKLKSKDKFLCQIAVAVVQSLKSNSLWPHGLQHAKLPLPSQSPRVCSNSWPLSQWCYSIISSSVAHFSSCPQSFPASGSFPMSWLFASGGQSTGPLASVLVLPMNIQGWFPLGLTGLISLLSKGHSKEFFSSTIQKHQFFSTQPSFTVQLSHPYMTTGKTQFWLYGSL